MVDVLIDSDSRLEELEMSWRNSSPSATDVTYERRFLSAGNDSKGKTFREVRNTGPFGRDNRSFHNMGREAR
jgi:hypothetical protein